jgi:TrmH family RNA methyltransferase
LRMSSSPRCRDCNSATPGEPYCNRNVTVTSPKNPLLKEIRRAVARGGLTADGCCVAETFHLVEEALRSECRIEAVILSESASARWQAPLHINAVIVPDELFREISATESNQGVMALVEPRPSTFEQMLVPEPLIVVIDGIQEPGNAGAILRAAEAFGASGVVFLKGSVSPYNPKAVRASAGSIFRLRHLTGADVETARERLSNLRIFAAMPDARLTLSSADLKGGCAVVIGSEGHGVGAGMQALAEGIRIPTKGVESLNAAVAAAVILYEAQRQRV